MSRRALIPLVVLLGLVAGTAVAQERLTVDTIRSPQFRRAFTTPTLRWLGDGSSLLYDRRPAPEDRTLERLDPATGARRRAVDARAALASLATLLGDAAAPPDELGWPDAVTADGRLAVSVVDGDLFLLTLGSSSYRRLTATPAREKDPKFSPDGTLLSFVRDNDLWVLDVASGQERRLTRNGSDTVLNGTLSWVYWEEIFYREDTASWWSPDGSAIAFLASDEAAVDVSVFPDFRPVNPTLHRQRYPKAGSVNPTVRLGIIDVAGGAVTWARLPQPTPEYLVRVQWLPDGRHVALETLDRIQRRLDLLLVDRSNGAVMPLLTETSTTSINVNDNLRFLSGGRFLWSSEREGHARLYLYGADGDLVGAVTPADLTLYPSLGGGGKGAVAAVDEAAGWVYFTAIVSADTGSPVAPQIYRVGLDGGEVQRLSGGAGSHRVAFDSTAHVYLDATSAAAEPPSLVLRRADGSSLATVTPPARDIVARYGLVTPSFLAVTTADGVALPVAIAKPREFDPAVRHPVVLYVYGGPAAPVVHDAWGRDTGLNNLLLDEGIVWVAADPRSATGRSKTLADDCYGRPLAAHEVSDIGAVVDWLKAQPWVDPARIGVWGWSGGGSFTLQLMTHSDAFKAGIAVAAVTDFHYYDTFWTEHMLGLPEQNPEGYRVSAPAEFAKQLHGRLLMMYGTFDDNVHPQNSLRFAHELITAGTPFEMMVYPMQKHGILADRSHVYRMLLDFWKRNL